jgi:anti-sigma B factor antagonist/stage II sporulation protein AA (anti-sigma F factor antagonist)
MDLAGVPYISSVGLRVLMVSAKQMRARGARIAVAALQPVVAEIFTISRFDAVLDVHASVRDALQRLSPAAFAAFEAAEGSARG